MSFWLIDIATKKLQTHSTDGSITDGKCETSNGVPVAVYRPVPQGFVRGNVVVVDDGQGNGHLSLTLAGDNDAKSSPLWEELRARRNAQLSYCDWTQLQDAPLAPEEQEDWATYRQSLRDLPQNTSDPESVTWPEEP